MQDDWFFNVSCMPLDMSIKTSGFKSENGFLIIAKGITSYEPTLETWIVEMMIRGEILVIDTKQMTIFSVNHGDWLKLTRFSEIIQYGKTNDNNDIKGEDSGAEDSNKSNKKSSKKKKALE